MSEALTAPEQPWLHHQAIAVDAPMTSLATSDGSMKDGADGLYLDDSRIVSTFRIDIDGGLSQVACASRGNVSEFLNSARRLGDGGVDPSVEVHLRRELNAPTATHTITVRSRASVPVHATLMVELGSDGLDIADVKHGSEFGPYLPITADGGTALWNTRHHEVKLTPSPAPSELVVQDGLARLSFAVDLAPGAEQKIILTITGRRLHTSLLDADAGSDSLNFAGRFTAVADDPRVAHAVNGALLDASHLALRDPLNADDVFLAAGTPWYLTLFGRDSLWAARMLLPLGTQLAEGTLRTLARRAGTKVDPAIAEQPGKIPHEVRRGEQGESAHFLPPIYYGTVDATSLWVSLLADAYNWGMDEATVASLMPALRGCLTWLTEYAAPDSDGLIKYIDNTGGGLANQGWKDSGDSIRFRDGRIADAPIALIEAQAYAVDAGRRGAALLRQFGTTDDEGLAAAAEAVAHRLEKSVRETFWVHAEGATWPAIALDGHGTPVSAIASNMGHCLGTGTFSTDETKRVVDVLSAPNMLSEYGIRTYADDNGAYNPIGYHTGSVWIHDTAICALGMAEDGYHDEVTKVARTMLAVTEYFAYRSPELHGDSGVLGRPIPYPASCRPQAWSATSTIAMLTAGLGLKVNAPAKTLTLRKGPSPFGAIRLEGVQVAGHALTIALDNQGEASVDGLPAGWNLERA